MKIGISLSTESPSVFCCHLQFEFIFKVFSLETEAVHMSKVLYLQYKFSPFLLIKLQLWLFPFLAIILGIS